MSFSFTVRAASKDEAKNKIAEKMDEVVIAQPAHELDRPAVSNVASAYIDMLDDDPARDIVVSVSGSLAWSGDVTGGVFHGASVSVNAILDVRALE
jgi:hypothetical protein